MQSLRDKNRRPTHPGEILLEDVLPELGISQTEFAEKLQVSRRTISEILHGYRALTPDMAIRISRLIGGTPDSWLQMQHAVDLWDLLHANSRLYAEIERQHKEIERLCKERLPEHAHEEKQINLSRSRELVAAAPAKRRARSYGR